MIPSATAASNAAITATNSRIAAQQENLYHTSNLLGTWSGKWNGSGNQSFTVKVDSITNGNASIEYTHNGQTQRGVAQVSKNIISFGTLQLATKNGSLGAAMFTSGSFQMTATVNKTVSAVPPAAKSSSASAKSSLSSLLGKLA